VFKVFIAVVFPLMLLFGNQAGNAQTLDRDQLVQTTTLCRACHRDKFESGEANPHSALDLPEWQQDTGVMLSCVGCHGDVTEHISGGGSLGTVLGFRSESTQEINDTCLSCHRATHPDFQRSEHALAGLTCTSCHSQHAHASGAEALLRAGPVTLPGGDRLSNVTQLCASCHTESVTDFAFNERHRLLEGVIDCASCHDPHSPQSRTLLGGFKQEACIDCHTDKGGPFVFEHQASRIEGCTACHSAHGSPNRHMLSHQRVGELCFTCHAAVPQFHSGFSPVAPVRFGLDTQCTNCHSTIHGSNFDPLFLK